MTSNSCPVIICGDYGASPSMHCIRCADFSSHAPNPMRTPAKFIRHLSIEGVICDQTIVFNGFYATQHYPENLRCVRFKDVESGKTLIFLTNNFALAPLTIEGLYKNRWQVSSFFKSIKLQHLRIKKLLGNSENVVKT